MQQIQVVDAVDQTIRDDRQVVNNFPAVEEIKVAEGAPQTQIAGEHSSAAQQVVVPALNVDDEQLGSELSGASEDVPDEVTDVTRSANYLIFYARNYKSDVLKSRKSAKKYLFRENEPQKLLIKPNAEGHAAH